MAVGREIPAPREAESSPGRTLTGAHDVGELNLQFDHDSANGLPSRVPLENLFAAASNRDMIQRNSSATSIGIQGPAQMYRFNPTLVGRLEILFTA